MSGVESSVVEAPPTARPVPPAVEHPQPHEPEHPPPSSPSSSPSPSSPSQPLPPSVETDSSAAAMDRSTTTTSTPTLPRRIRRRPRRTNQSNSNTTNNTVLTWPTDGLFDQVVQASGLPCDVYRLELLKTVHTIVTMQCTHVALQLPEGLVRYATALADVLVTLCRAAVLQRTTGAGTATTSTLTTSTLTTSTLTTTSTPTTSTPTTSTPTTGQLTHVSILADVTYGACCVDDITASALGCQLLIHYGHSCLVPLQHSVLPVLYVFVELAVARPEHVTECLVATLIQQPPHDVHQQQAITATATGTTNTNATSRSCTTISSTRSSPPTGNQAPPSQPPQQQQQQPTTHVYLLGTIQFRHALVTIRDQLLHQCNKTNSNTNTNTNDQPPLRLTVSIPQCHPLSPGEVLGCTSPKLTDHLTHASSSTAARPRAIVCFVADGRFHLEATMISHRHGIDAFYRYDPYTHVLTHETYDHASMSRLRSAAIQSARTAQTFGILLGTLGRQGNPAIVQRVQEVLRRAQRRYYVLLVSEITTAKLQLLAASTDAWVQVACPRLSVDWGHVLGGGVPSEDTNGTNNKNSSSSIPVLSPYELFVCLDPKTSPASWQKEEYPMDYYSTAGGPWSNYYATNKDRQLHPLTTTNTDAVE